MKEITINKKAKFLYFLEDEYMAGIELKGCEVKSVRAGKVSLDQSYVTIDANNEVYLINCYIKQYENTAYFIEDERRRRKLLLNRQEINKIQKHIKIKGGTIVPTKIVLNEQGKVKVFISTAKGKKQYDKNQISKEKSQEQSIKRTLKEYYNI